MRLRLALVLALSLSAVAPAGNVLAQEAAARNGGTDGNAAKDVAFLPGAGIGLVPPPGMVPATGGFQGYEHPGTGASIALFELPPEAFERLTNEFTPDLLEKQGLEGARRETSRVAGAKGAFLVSGEQAAGPARVRKWMLVAGTARQTALAIGQVLIGREPPGEAEIRAALDSLAFRDPPPLAEQMEALPFRVGDLAGFRVVRVLGGTSLILTEGDKDTVEKAAQPLLLMGAGSGPIPEASREAFARQALTSVAGLSEIRVERAQGFRQRNAPWHEIVATAKEREGEPVVLIQSILFTPGGYVRSLGVTHASARQAILPRFRKAIDSIEIE